MDIEKYEHILRPLRELEQVWGIDLAGTLMEYAAEVSAVTYEMGSQVLNFAQAAMLIMGASTIYQKKVDALQELVQDTYYLIINKGQRDDEKDGKRGRRRRVVVREPVKFTEAATRVPLMPADKRHKDDVPETLRLMLAGLDPGAGGKGGGRGIRIAEGELVPFEDTQTGAVNYRLSICSLTDEGLLLPNVRHELSASCRLQPFEGQDANRGGVRMPPTPAHYLSAQKLHLMDGMTSARKSEAGGRRLDEHGFDKLLQEELDAADDDDDDERKEAQQAEEAEPGDLDDYDMIMRACNQDRFAVTLPDKPWEPCVIRPRRAAQDPTKAIMANLLADKMVSTASRHLRHLNARGEVVWDSERVARLAPALYRDLVEVIRRAKNSVRSTLSRNRKYERWLERQRGNGYGDAEAYEDAEEEQQVEENLLVGGGEDVDGAEHDDEYVDGDDGPTAAALFQQAMGFAGETDCEVSFYSSLARYDELLFQHNLAATDRQANLTKEEAELHSRISEWSKMLEPMLDEQLGRGTYDIYTYAQKIIDTFDHEGQVLPFKALTDQCRGLWEVSRFFLAMLQLSNNGNLYIAVQRVYDGQKSDTISLKLLTASAKFKFDDTDGDTAFAAGKEKLKDLKDCPIESMQPQEDVDVHRHDKKKRKRKSKKQEDKEAQEGKEAPAEEPEAVKTEAEAERAPAEPAPAAEAVMEP